MISLVLAVLTMSSQTDAIKANGSLLSVVQRLHTISARSDIDANDRLTLVEDAVATLDTPADLYRVARISLVMTSGLAEHEQIDDAYRAAFWVAARRLASSADEESIRRLEVLAEQADFDGGDLMAIKELLARQSRPPVSNEK